MNFKTLDDPALLMPRVMNVRATLTGLGFVPCVYKGKLFYRLNVLLHLPVESRTYRRAISYVNLCISIHESSEEVRLELRVTYGYPTKVCRGTRVLENFKNLGDQEQFEYVICKDQELRAVEETLKLAITNMRTKKVDRSFIDDDLHARTLPGWEALSYAVKFDLRQHNNIIKSRRYRRPYDPEDDSWWKAPPSFKVRDEPAKAREDEVRLPNFDRSNRPRHRSFR